MPIWHKKYKRGGVLILGVDLGNWNVKTSEEDIFPSRYTIVENILGAINVKGKKQYYINGYRIDYYIPLYNIAIEYDANSRRLSARWTLKTTMIRPIKKLI